MALAATGAPFELHIVGDDSLVGPSGQTYREVSSGTTQSSPARVRFLGRVDDEELRHQYVACDVFVAPSRFESFGLILLEAMMFAKPVVCVGHRWHDARSCVTVCRGSWCLPTTSPP